MNIGIPEEIKFNNNLNEEEMDAKKSATHETGELKNIDNLVIPVDRFAKHETNSGINSQDIGFLKRNVGNN